MGAVAAHVPRRYRKIGGNVKSFAIYLICRDGPKRTVFCADGVIGG